MRTRLLINVGLIIGAALATSSIALAQQAGYPPPPVIPIYGPSTEGHRSPPSMKAAAAAPKPAYDPKDLSGVWWGRGNSILMGNDVPPLTPEGQKAFDMNKPAAGPRGVPPALANDPIGNCDPSGYPRNLYYNGRSFEMIMLPNKILQMMEWDHVSREIWLDGRKMSDNVDPRWYGYAIGHWDGNTLVVDSGAYDARTWLDALGNPHTEDMTMEEKFTHPDALTLTDTMTINDPKFYTKPWVSAKPQVFQLQLPKGPTELREEFCVPSEEQEFNNNTRNPAGGISQTHEVR
jgi:hypothetical protein